MGESDEKQEKISTNTGQEVRHRLSLALKNIGVEASAAAIVALILALVSFVADAAGLAAAMESLGTAAPLVIGILSGLLSISIVFAVGIRLYSWRTRTRQLEKARLLEKEAFFFASIEEDFSGLLMERGS